MPLNSQCSLLSGGKTDFPCNATAIEAVSLAIGAALISLLFVLYLIQQVSSRDPSSFLSSSFVVLSLLYAYGLGLLREYWKGDPIISDHKIMEPIDTAFLRG